MDELLQQMAILHESINTSHTPPSLIIVDRLDVFLCGPGEGSHSRSHFGVQSCTSQLLALLNDTAAFFTQILEQRALSSGPCRIIASFQSEDVNAQPATTDPIMDVLVRYFEVQGILEQDRSYETVATGPQEVWYIYLSERGFTQASWTKNPVDMQGVAVWKLLIFPDGLMEFKLV